MKKVTAKLVLIMCVMMLAVFISGINTLSAKDKPIKLLYGSFDPPKNVFSKVWADYAKELEERSGGRVEVQFNWFSGKPGEFFELTTRGVFDFCWAVPTINPGLFELTGIAELPWILPTCEIASKAINEYFKKGYMDKRFDEVKVLWFGAMNSDYILLGKKPVDKFSDFKGMKISAAGPIMSKRVQYMGGIPTFIPFPEQYGAMLKGIIDGTVMSFMMMEAFRLAEVSNYVLAPPMGTGVYAVAMNKKKWNSLPPDIQNILDDMSKKYVIEFARTWDAASVRGEKLFLDKGGKINELKGKDLEKANKMVQPLWQDWITTMEKKGLPGQKAVDDMYAIIKGLGIETPAVGYAP